MSISKPKIVAVVGTTASGKTGLGVDIARKFKGEVVSADSRQVYKGMDVGTGKDLADYSVRTWWGKTVNIPYHLIDVVEPTEEFDLARFQKQAYKAIDDILARGKLPILVGGTGLYAQAVVEGYELSSAGRSRELRRRAEEMTVEELFKKIEHKDPDFASRINRSDRLNKRRLVRYWEKLEQGESVRGTSRSPRYHSLVLGVTHPKKELEERIYKRLIQWLEKEGMIDEVKDLLYNRKVSSERLESFGLEYKWVSYYLKGEVDYQKMVNESYREIKRFAGRQLSWLRRWERRGRKIYWVDGKEQARREVRKFLKE